MIVKINIFDFKCVKTNCHVKLFFTGRSASNLTLFTDLFTSPLEKFSAWKVESESENNSRFTSH